MEWSIFKDTSGEYEQWELADAAFYWDYDSDASPTNRLKFFKDGVHEVFFDTSSCKIEVINGKFDINKVIPLIKYIVEEDEYWGTFIEGFHKKDGKFFVCIGS